MSNKKAWSVLHNLILDGVVTEKESWQLARAIFEKEKEFIPTPFPVPAIEEENPVDEVPKDKEEVTVRGFGQE